MSGVAKISILVSLVNVVVGSALNPVNPATRDFSRKHTPTRAAREAPCAASGEDGGLEVTFIAECALPTSVGPFRMRAYRHRAANGEIMEPVVMVPVNFTLGCHAPE